MLSVFKKNKLCRFLMCSQDVTPTTLEQWFSKVWYPDRQHEHYLRMCTNAHSKGHPRSGESKMFKQDLMYNKVWELLPTKNLRWKHWSCWFQLKGEKTTKNIISLYYFTHNSHSVIQSSKKKKKKNTEKWVKKNHHLHFHHPKITTVNSLVNSFPLFSFVLHHCNPQEITISCFYHRTLTYKLLCKSKVAI